LTEAKNFCRACRSDDVIELESYRKLRRVTSDCRQLERGGKLYYCSKCGLTQKMVGESLENELRAIYDSYETYICNIEPLVFSSDATTLRSNLILNEFREILQSVDSGIHVDVGCGDGAFLKELNKCCPNWTSYGYDINQARQTEIEGICGIGRFISNSLKNIPDNVDLITLNYVLEHIDNVSEILNILTRKLSFRGFLVFVVPNLLENPFDLVVGDHLSHYTRDTMSVQLDMLDIIDERNFLDKELMVLAKRSKNHRDSCDVNVSRTQIHGKEIVEFLLNVRCHVMSEQKKAKSFGIFGTAIAGTWLGCELEGKEFFFVDENPQKIGTIHLGKVVLHPRDIPDHSSVYLPFGETIVESIKKRLKHHDTVAFISPE